MRFFRMLTALTLLSMSMPIARAANLPRPSPDFGINLDQGKQVRISQYKGKTLVVAFILTYVHMRSCMRVRAGLCVRLYISIGELIY